LVIELVARLVTGLVTGLVTELMLNWRLNSLVPVQKKKFLRTKCMKRNHLCTTQNAASMNTQALTSQSTSLQDAPESNTPPTTQNPPKKRSLEFCVSEFVEKGWKLLESVQPIKEYLSASLKDMPTGEPKSMYFCDSKE